ncbi:hypothetical protein [Microcella pacifica]|uniref:Uncharacterized protein n=1 Tax=Microcella pacifica TaxID=2591847 RepID=A0A9E5JPB1_9MICO|nr:hypothetical protein [Microcella pacifica]NHF63150.1 hypothetical protein [Microcella pacifica]
MTTIALILLALLAAGIGATIIAIMRDGYRRVPRARPLREYERDDHYRA